MSASSDAMKNGIVTEYRFLSCRVGLLMGSCAPEPPHHTICQTNIYGKSRLGYHDKKCRCTDLDSTPARVSELARQYSHMTIILEDPNRLADLSKPAQTFLPRAFTSRNRIFGAPHRFVREAVYM